MLVRPRVNNRTRRANWCFTINNPVEQLHPENFPKIKRAVWQLERGEQGTLHYQGYIEFTASVRFNAVISLPGMERCHLEGRLGTAEQSITYCTKEDTREGGDAGPWYYPEKEEFDALGVNNQGRRNDIHNMVLDVKNGASDRELVENHPVPYLKYHRGVAHIRSVMRTRDVHEVAQIEEMICYVGPTGTGKSHKLRQECPEGPEWYWATEGKWWDGYEGQPGIVFDEFRDHWYKWSTLLKICDISPNRVEIKGGCVQLAASKFRFSSNVHPKFWYKGVSGQPNSPWEQSPLRRRFTKIVFMLEKYVPPDEPEQAPEPWVPQYEGHWPQLNELQDEERPDAADDPQVIDLLDEDKIFDDIIEAERLLRDLREASSP
jgi:hypothetical protein